MGFPVFPLQWIDPDSGEVSSGYRESGYFPEAVINMLAFLGWNPGTEQELFSLDELVSAFSIDRVGKSGARFDPEKVKWYNQQYLRMKSDSELVARIKAELIKNEIHVSGNLDKIVSMVKERLIFPKDFWDQASYFFVAPKEYDRDMQKKIWKSDTPVIIEAVKDLFRKTSDFTSEELEKLINQYIAEKNIGFGKVASPLRLLVVGSGMGPHLFDILEIIGREETIRRIENGMKVLGNG